MSPLRLRRLLWVEQRWRSFSAVDYLPPSPLMNEAME
ncbi:unnamed protein product [Arabidopsis halleri]